MLFGEGDESASASQRITRRAAVRGATWAALATAIPVGRVLGQTATVDEETLRAAPVFNEYRYGHMVQAYYVQRLRNISRRRAQARAKIETPEQVMQLRERVRLKLAECYGPLPERTPLNPRMTGSVERERYTIEKLIYESRPNYLVTGNVYVPKDRAERMPAVLGACGHSANGKAAEAYQEFARNLARLGYVVLIYDPPAQGERLEYPDSEAEPGVAGGTHSHNLAGNQMTLLGKNFALWEAWDGIRGVDYLLSRPDVDPTRIGVTGNSGGGTQTSHLCALDDRFTMAAPNCFVTRFVNNLENEEPTDAEQIVPGMLAAGLDMADFFVAQIPRPVRLGGEVNDFFDVRGLRKTYEELRRLYAILGEKDKVELYVGPGTHGYNRGARENMYGFFNKHAGVDGSTDEPQVPVEPDNVLQVTPGGQVHLLDSLRTCDFTREEASGLAANRTRLSRGSLVRAVRQSLRLPGRGQLPSYRVMRARRIWNNPLLTDYGFVVETEPKIVAMLHAVHKQGEPQYRFPRGERATLYIPHRSSLQEMLLGQSPDVPDEDIRFALDVRGIGQLTARTHKDSGHDFFHYYHSDFMYANHGLMLRQPYAGRRVHDVLRVLDLFRANGYRQIHLVGRGLGAVTATFAAIVHPLVSQVTLHNALLSYHELTQEPRYAWPLSSMVFGMLKTFDLPDCLWQLTVSKDLKIIDPWDSRMQLWARDEITPHLRSLGLERLDIGWSEGTSIGGNRS